MKRSRARIAFVLSVLGVMFLLRDGRTMEIQVGSSGVDFIQVGDTWKFFRGRTAPSDPADAWQELGFVDTGWESGPTGIGYGDGDDATFLDDMEDGDYVTVYARHVFEVTAPVPEGVLQLVMDYDDGFVAYLNGSEVARSDSMPDGTPTFETTASSHDAGTPEKFVLGNAQDLLQVGDNVLAIEGHNISNTSTDFSLIPELLAAPNVAQVGDLWVVDTTTVTLTGTVDDPTVVTVKINGVEATFDAGAGTWQGDVSIVPGVSEVTVEGLDASTAVVEEGSVQLLLVPAANHVSGTLTESTTWAGAYVLEGDVTVPVGVRLDVDAGTILLLQDDVSIIVEGQLIASGTEAAPVYFTHAAEGAAWKQIFLQGAEDSSFTHCVFEYAKCDGEHQDYYEPGSRDYHEAITAVACRVDFDDCLFRDLLGGDSGKEGDAIAIISDDPDFPGTATANVRRCDFISIGQGVHERFSYVLVEECFFTDKHGDNDDVDLWGESDPPPLVLNNVFLDPAYDDMINPTKCSAVIIGNLIGGANDHGVVLRGACSPIMMNNVIFDCRNAAIAVENSCEALLVNNTIEDCGDRGLRLFDLGRWGPPYRLEPGGGTATVINCIIRNTPRPITVNDSSNTEIEDQGSHITVLYSNIEGGEGAISVSGSESTVTWGEGNIDEEPRYVDAANRDFRLRSDSPMIDAGLSSDETPTDDFDGTPRPCGAAHDIGAFEYCDELPPRFVRGDANADGESDISDAVMVLLYLYAGGEAPACLKSADVDDDADIGINDPTHLLRYFFQSGDPIPEPVGSCGTDPTDDPTTTCDSYPPCG